jgi:hypothetical protein
VVKYPSKNKIILLVSITCPQDTGNRAAKPQVFSLQSIRWRQMVKIINEMSLWSEKALHILYGKRATGL